jgi:hypothetical protein
MSELTPRIHGPAALTTAAGVFPTALVFVMAGRLNRTALPPPRRPDDYDGVPSHAGE